MCVLTGSGTTDRRSEFGRRCADSGESMHVSGGGVPRRFSSGWLVWVPGVSLAPVCNCLVASSCLSLPVLSGSVCQACGRHLIHSMLLRICYSAVDVVAHVAMQLISDQRCFSAPINAESCHPLIYFQSILCWLCTGSVRPVSK